MSLLRSILMSRVFKSSGSPIYMISCRLLFIFFFVGLGPGLWLGPWYGFAQATGCEAY